MGFELYSGAYFNVNIHLYFFDNQKKKITKIE